jgi:hypothetical protein
MKKIVLVLVLAIACLLTGCSRSKITKANFEKIKVGMTKAEVVAILGEPTGSELVFQINDNQTFAPVWEAPDFKIVAAFSPDGKLLVKRLDTDE